MPAPSVSNTRWPTVVFSTMSANTICRLRPQATVVQLIARRLFEKATAMREDHDRAEQRLQDADHQTDLSDDQATRRGRLVANGDRPAGQPRSRASQPAGDPG